MGVVIWAAWWWCGAICFVVVWQALSRSLVVLVVRECCVVLPLVLVVGSAVTAVTVRHRLPACLPVRPLLRSARPVFRSLVAPAV